MPWRTPTLDTTRRLIVRRVVFYREYIHEIDAALCELLAPGNWVEQGTITKDQALQELNDMYDFFLVSDDLMIGSIHEYSVKTLPEGVLPCDGTQYNRVDYPRLYAAISDDCIVDSDHFVTPDMRGRVPVGAGTGSGLTPRAVGQSGGEETHGLTIDELPAHTHAAHEHGVDFDVEGPAGVPQLVTGYSFSSTTGSTGGDAEHENMQPFRVVQYGIVAL